MALVKSRRGVSRFDIAISLRLLERKWMRVESNLWITEEDDIGALGDITPSWSEEELVGHPREANFSIRIDSDPKDWTDTDEAEACLLHELVHAAQIERSGVTASTGDFTAAHADPEDGCLSTVDQITYYRIFPYEREAKELEIKLALGAANRDYWRGILAGAK